MVAMEWASEKNKRLLTTSRVLHIQKHNLRVTDPSPLCFRGFAPSLLDTRLWLVQLARGGEEDLRVGSSRTQPEALSLLVALV